MAVFVTFAMVVRPYLLHFLDCADGLIPMALTVLANFSRSFPVKRQKYLRARFEVSDYGVISASLHDNRCSGALSAANWSNGFAVQPVDQLIASADSVKFIPYSELFG